MIGVDGNMWYVSNDLDLGDPRAKYSFERTLREAIRHYNYNHVKEREPYFVCPDNLLEFLDKTPVQYKEVSA